MSKEKCTGCFRDPEDFMLNQYVQTIKGSPCACKAEDVRDISCSHVFKFPFDGISENFTESQKKNLFEFQAMTRRTVSVVKELLNEKNYENSHIIDVKKDYGSWNAPNTNIKNALKKIIKNSELHDREKDVVLVLSKEAAEVLDMRISYDCKIRSTTEIAKSLTEYLGYRVVIEDCVVGAPKGGEYIWPKQKAVICMRSEARSYLDSTCVMFVVKEVFSSAEEEAKTDEKKDIPAEEYIFRFTPSLGILLVNLF